MKAHGDGNVVDEDSIEDDHTHDRWSMEDQYLVRIHVVPRKRLFVPNEANDDPPIPLELVDVFRVTKANLEGSEEMIQDLWTSEEIGIRPLSANWVGQTRFALIDQTEGRSMRKGHYIEHDRDVRANTSWRVPGVPTEAWNAAGNSANGRA